MPPSLRLLLPALLLAPLAAHAQPNPNLWRYSCGPANRTFATLSPTSLYTPTSAGFDLGTAPSIQGNACTSTDPFFLSIPVPEGAFRITVTLGGPVASVTTVRAEARRLMLQQLPTPAGKSTTRSFDVDVRTPDIYTDASSQTSGKSVHLKPREIGSLDWDHKLTLEFNGDHPSLRSLTVTPIPPHTPTLYLAGDSTVVDQDTEPWAAWGQMLPRFFLPGLVVANHAESGETIRSFTSEQRFAKIFSRMQPGDYLFLQFNHNDQKIDPKTHQPVVPLDTYRQLLTQYISLTRQLGATPVLVTSMNRRTFDAAGHITNSLGDYPEAMRSVARDQNVTLLDLNQMSKTLFEALGPEDSKHAFMHFAANTLPNQTEAISDDTHFNIYGAFELARCIVLAIQNSTLPLKKFLAPNLPPFNPAHPDPLATFTLPHTPIPPKQDPTKIPQT